ncbi:Bud site selection protein 20 [Gaertneriomyces sp. JEL0708]|nr:Bud site selection protein 20 [Gaertneriomyces sp. JEL0708]
MTRYRRTKTHKGIRDVKRAKRTRARTKDLDQIHDDMAQPEKFTSQPIDADLPGLGQHYCLQCARYFTESSALNDHYKTKLHKKRLKVLKEAPYTQKEAEAAVGLQTENGRPGLTQAATASSAASAETEMQTGA